MQASSSSFTQPGRKRQSTASTSSSQSTKSTQQQQSSSPPPPRVVILVDLDCFYAQCECVRLGYDSLTTPLVLMQWNSALAVTYPARNQFDIKRGDSWHEVHEKSKGQCRAIHVPIMTRNDNTTAPTVGGGLSNGNITSATADATCVADDAAITDVQPLTDRDASADATAANNTSSSADAKDDPMLVDHPNKNYGNDEYHQVFQLTSEQQQQARASELNVRKHPEQGKACIERYRIASMQIIRVVRSFLQQHSWHTCVQLERASIDEFYLDVTEACWKGLQEFQPTNPASYPEEWEQALQETNVIGTSTTTDDDDNNNVSSETHAVVGCDGDLDDDNVEDDAVDSGIERENASNTSLALQYGCWLAWKLRQAVRHQLGFTLSAGVASNKLLGKLSASYGKPSGQAVLFPQHVPWLLQQTPIRKCRNLGGKLGKRLQTLLPSQAPTTVGALAQRLTFHQLTNELHLKPETARWVLDYVQGMDTEPVQQESTVKTITAFKSLNKHPILSDCYSWFALLVQEIVTRVENDSKRNHRYPRFYQVQYHIYNPSNTKPLWQQSSKGWKSTFPGYSMSTSQKVHEILSKIIPTIANKEKNHNKSPIRLDYIGLCAVDFVIRPTSNARSFFVANHPTSTTTNTTTTIPSGDKSEKSALNTTAGDESSDVEAVLLDDMRRGDAAMAQRLQCAYDGEDRLLQSFDSQRTTQEPDQANTTTKRGNDDGPSACGMKKHNPSPVEKEACDDPDLALAKRLQAEYDRENRMIQALERRGSSGKAPKKPRTRRIDAYFQSKA